ncbi:MAG: CARDB domain-containing protein, partial [Promethearchaeota archaeon]
YGSLDSPELNRGGKDVHEGYGRLNIDIALEAYSNELTSGSSQNGLIKSSLEDAFTKHGIGCHVNLNNGEQCTITLDVPTGADFDLYMYSNDPSSIGEPILVASSTSSGLGVDEMISYTSSSGGKYYLIAKAISGEGIANISYIVLDHELSVSLDIPDSPQIGNSYIINATVFNGGDNIETDVDLYLYLNGMIVNSSIISTLSIGASSTINYSWTPIDYGIYNFTVYSPPLFSESFIENNMLVKILAIRNITLFDGMYINYTWSIFGSDMPAQFAYSYLSGDMFHVDWYMNSTYYDYWDIDSQTRIMSNGGGSGWYFGDGYHTPIWIFPNVSIGEQLYIAVDAEGDHLFEVTDEILYDLPGSGMLEVWVLEDLTLPGGLGLYEKNTGVLISGIFFYSGGGMYNYTFSFIDTNLVFDYFILDHDLSVSLEVPEYPEIGNTYVVNATVYNNGIYEETSVNLTLYLDSVIVDSVMVPSLPIGGSEIINYIWTPSEYRTYNFTAIAPPIAGEIYTINNIVIELITISKLMNYTMIPNYIFDWTDASGGTELNLDDDGYASVILPFNFQFYDKSFSTIHLSANGYLSFSDSTPYEYINVDFPSGSSSHTYMIAPFWDDLYPPSGGHIYVQSFGSYWVAEWQDIYHIGGPLVGSFQIVLFETGDIVFNYDYLDYTSGGYTCGLNYGLDISYFNVYRDLSVSTDDFSILFTPQLRPWEHDLSVSLTIPEYIEVGETYNINASVVNNGIYNETNVDLFLYLDTIIVNSINIPFLPSGTSHTISYLWTPTEYRTYNFTVYSPPITNETFTSNNYKTKLAFLNVITLFDGMYLNHTFSIMNIAGPSRFSYSYISGNIFHVNWDFFLNNTLYHGSWDVDAKTRLITGSTGMTLFPNFTHTPVWIFPNIIIGQIIPISVATEGDHEFIVSRDFTYNLPGYGSVNVWELEDLTYPGGFAWYEKTSGILLNSTFFFFTGGIYNYSFELTETNVLEEGDVPPGDFILLTNAGNPDIDGEFTLVWSDSEGALTYSVYEYSRVITVINESLNLLSTGITGNTIPLSGYSTGTYYFTVVAENNSGVTLSNCIGITVEKPKRRSHGIPSYNLLLLVALISTVNLIFLIRIRFNKDKHKKKNKKEENS